MADAVKMVTRCRVHGQVTSIPLADLTPEQQAEVTPKDTDQTQPYGQITLQAGEPPRPDHRPIESEPDVER